MFCCRWMVAEQEKRVSVIHREETVSWLVMRPICSILNRLSLELIAAPPMYQVNVRIMIPLLISAMAVAVQLKTATSPRLYGPDDSNSTVGAGTEGEHCQV